MKKSVCILLTFAILFAFAACGKNKGELYVEPPTEVISFEDGETAVYEVVTDEAGVAVTKENGENEVVLYDPPVTERGGYLVTDPEGSTIRQSATTVNTATENEDIEFDEPANGTTVKSEPSGTTKFSEKTTGKSEENKTVTSSAAGNSVLIPGEDKTTAKAPSTEKNTTVNVSSAEKETTTKKDSGTVKETMAPELPEGETGEFGTEISKADAQKLYNILNFENTFDKALSIPDYHKAEKELKTYMSKIENAIAQIKADKTLYQYVGNQNLKQWLAYMQEAQDKYTIFMNIYKEIEGYDEYPASFYTAYEDFRDSYRSALKIYYSMRTGAEAIMYS